MGEIIAICLRSASHVGIGDDGGIAGTSKLPAGDFVLQPKH